MKSFNVANPQTAVKVDLTAMLPPISKLDANMLNQLYACEHLALSSNAISSMIGIPSGMKDLKILSLGRNRIKKLDQLDQCANSLQQLWISYNEIESLSGGGLDKCHKLTHLYISNNNIKKLDELSKISHLPLTDLILAGNPCYEGWQPSDIRRLILYRLPQLQKIDGAPVTERERISAAALTEEESRMTPAQMYAAQLAKEKAERALKEQSDEPAKAATAGSSSKKKKKTNDETSNNRKSSVSPRKKVGK